MLRIRRHCPTQGNRVSRGPVISGAALYIFPFFILLVLILLSFSLPAMALADDLVIEGAWIRLPPPGANTAGYMTLVNPGDAPMRVMGVTSESVARVELHESSVEGGVARMQHVDAIEVPAHGRVTLAPRGLHLMLIRPGTLLEGGTVTLVFELDGQVAQTVVVPIRREAAEP